MKIMIDAGHGGTDPGAVNPRLNLKEADVTLAYAKALRDRLSMAGHSALLTRSKDSFVSLSARSSISNLIAPNIFISLHCNAAENVTANGIEVWTSVGQTASDVVATHVFEAVKAAFPDKTMRADMIDGDPDKESPFSVLVKTTAPAILLELGFLSNDVEAGWLNDEDTRNAYAYAIAEGLKTWEGSVG